MFLQRYICQKKKSDYERVVYTRSKKNYRYFIPVPRDSELWRKLLYSKRSVSERSFKVKKGNYKLSIPEQGTERGKSWTIQAALACMCQHIDVQAQALGFAKSEKLKEGLTAT